LRFYEEMKEIQRGLFGGAEAIKGCIRKQIVYIGQESSGLLLIVRTVNNIKFKKNNIKSQNSIS